MVYSWVCKSARYTPMKSNIDTQNSHVWKEIHFQTIFFGIYVRFQGVYTKIELLKEVWDTPKKSKKGRAIVWQIETVPTLSFLVAVS